MKLISLKCQLEKKNLLNLTTYNPYKMKQKVKKMFSKKDKKKILEILNNNFILNMTHTTLTKKEKEW